MALWKKSTDLMKLSQKLKGDLPKNWNVSAKCFSLHFYFTRINSLPGEMELTWIGLSASQFALKILCLSLVLKALDG